ncbi:MAG: type I methionyl aminopeptidase [Clostridiaceae bacterium]|nr:type I methionyl aminopeptidase [Eubacteriales bacterium]
MTITVKTPEQIELMRAAGSVVAQALEAVGELVRPGVTTAELNEAADALIRSKGAVPSFLGYNNYPKSICTSVNAAVVHGIPGSYVLKDGDIVSVDIGAILYGWQGDAARTFYVGSVAPEVQRLCEVTKECFFEGIKFAKPGCHIADISAAIERHAQSHGYGVVRELTGHGIGTHMHEPPSIPNFVDARDGRGVKLVKGMTLAIEPMINLGKRDVWTLADGWTVETRDKKPSAHYENTIAVTDDEPLLLTLTRGC